MCPTDCGGPAGRGSWRTWSSVSLSAGVFAEMTEGVEVACGVGVALRVWECANSVEVAAVACSVGRCEAPAIVPW